MATEPRPKGSAYDAWFDAIKAKYPDARARTTGEYGWSTLGFDDNGPTLTPKMSGPHYTDVTSQSYSSSRMIGSFDHNSNSGKYYAPVDVPVDTAAE